MIDPFVDAGTAARLQSEGAVLADVRWYLDGRDARAAFAAGHPDGAVFVDLERDLAGHDRPPTEGRHPLPDPGAFARAMEALGIGDETVVIAYDDTGGMTAGRLVVMLRMLGHEAALLDGGLAAWTGTIVTGTDDPRPVPPGSFTPAPWPEDRLADADRIARVAVSPGGLAIDARSHERFTGEVTAVDPRPGHVPGARSAPWTAVLDADGHVRGVADLRRHFTALGADRADEVVASCGSGVSACLDVLALEHAGFAPPRLYVASWSGWSADPARPVALGD